MTADFDEKNWSELKTIVATTAEFHRVPICVSDDDVMISQRPARVVGIQSQQQTTENNTLTIMSDPESQAHQKTDIMRELTEDQVTEKNTILNF